MSRRDNVIVLADHLRPRLSVWPWIWVLVLAGGLLLTAYLEVPRG